MTKNEARELAERNDEMDTIMERIINEMIGSARTGTYTKDYIWTDGIEILCNSENRAECIADFLEALGVEYVRTGFYDPEEDRRNHEVDHRTGWYYVDWD